MIRCLLYKMSSFCFLLVLIAFTPTSLQAQQGLLKSQAVEPQAVQKITGHNNLRKLAKIYDQSVQGSDAPKPVGDDAQLRRLYEINLLKDPATGTIPYGIRERELAFAKKMEQRFGKSRASSGRIVSDWQARGPYNVGGRTRALAIDLDNENVILAGGVSGGMWRSEDGGLTWAKTTGSNEVQSVTAVAQDPRPGFRNIWYYSAGERFGNSASGGGAFFGGNGIYKSTDGGRTWGVLPVTSDNKPQSNTPFDITFNLAVHPATGDLYAATWWGVHRSQDGGSSFTEVISGGLDTWADIMITPGGVLYVGFDSDGTPSKGMWRSTDGTTWTNITPATGFPSATATVYGRIVFGYTPTNENIVYALIDNGLGNGAGFIWRYTHGNATPWTNLSGSTPAFGGNVGNLNTQGGYNMLIKVHPSNPNIVFIGATNLYRSPNGFTSRTGMVWVGGYSPANNVSIYPNQHPDHHCLLFYPSDPAKALSATDGGIHFTNNILSSNAGTQPVVWTSRNNGYLTTQPYTVSLDPSATTDNLAAGFQDNGSWFTNSTTLSNPWTEIFGGDGSYNAFADGGKTRYASSQNGNLYRFNYNDANDAGGAYVSFTRVTPAGATGFSFVNPFVLDPHNDNMMYMPAGGRIWRNDNLDGIPLFSNAATSVNWFNITNSLVPAGNTITALAISRMPANRLYYGTNTGRIYRIDNANIGDQPKTDISTGKGLPTGNVNCITVDPANADRVFAVFSNYNIRSIFYSEDGGNSWTDISSNLEETAAGTGSGPSVRWLAIEGNSDRYYLGTSTGLYSTTELNGNSTVWTQEDVDGIGNVVVSMIRTRDDGFVAVASHGNGLYSGKFEVTPLPQPQLKVVNLLNDVDVFVNSPTTIIDIGNVFEHTNGGSITYSLINTNPSLVTASLVGNQVVLAYAPNATGTATIGLLATSGSEVVSEPFNVTVRNLEYLLHDQSTAALGTRPSQFFTDFNALAQSADDFTVPAGQTWTIERVNTQGAVNGAPVLNSAFVVIYQDASGAPGAEVYNSGSLLPTSGTANANMQVALTTPATLPAGKYWISVYARVAFAGANQWFWRTTGTVKGTQGYFKDPANLFGRGAINWTAQSTAFGGVQTDMIFTLFGKGAGAPTPAAPSDLTALYDTDTRFNLTWSDNSSDEFAFLIQRSNDGLNFVRHTTVGANKTSYSDTEFFDPALTYYYRVAAIGLSDTSEYSNVAATAIIPDAPEAKLASYVVTKSFTANWNATVGASYYELEVSADDFNTFLTGYDSMQVSGTSQFVSPTDKKASYKYRVRAVNAGGTSPNSNVIIVAKIKDLGLDAVCSESPGTFRKWRIKNPNPFAVEVQWSVYQASHAGTVIAEPGFTYFTTPTVAGENNTIITWMDDEQVSHVAIKSSTETQCGPDTQAIVGRDDDSFDVIETNSPYITEAYPNPAKEKFNIMIASPANQDVELEIVSLRGELLQTLKTKSNIVVNIDAVGYRPGMYLVKTKQAGKHQTLKVIKQ